MLFLSIGRKGISLSLPRPVIPLSGNTKVGGIKGRRSIAATYYPPWDQKPLDIFWADNGILEKDAV